MEDATAYREKAIYGRRTLASPRCTLKLPIVTLWTDSPLAPDNLFTLGSCDGAPPSSQFRLACWRAPLRRRRFMPTAPAAQRTTSTDEMRKEALRLFGFARSATSANCSMPM